MAEREQVVITPNLIRLDLGEESHVKRRSSSGSVINKGARREKLIFAIGKRWMEHYPHEVIHYCKEVKQVRETLAHPRTAMSHGGTMAILALIPDRVQVLAQRLDPDLGDDPTELSRTWLRVFPAFALKAPK